MLLLLPFPLRFPSPSPSPSPSHSNFLHMKYFPYVDCSWWIHSPSVVHRTRHKLTNAHVIILDKEERMLHFDRNQNQSQRNSSKFHIPYSIFHSHSSSLFIFFRKRRRTEKYENESVAHEYVRCT